MRIAVCTAATPDYEPLAVLTRANLQAYCDRHGYEMRYDVYRGPLREFGFFHVDMVRDVLKTGKYEAAMWIDADAFVTNPDFTIEDILLCRPVGIVDGENVYRRAENVEPSLYCTHDCFGPNMGVFVAVNCPHVRQLLWAVSVTRGKPEYKDEQSAIWDMRSRPPYDAVIECLPQRVMNSYPNREYRDGREVELGNWEKGDFICHMPGIPGRNFDEVLQRRIAIFRHWERFGEMPPVEGE
jgi:hypothetical protein